MPLVEPDALAESKQRLRGRMARLRDRVEPDFARKAADAAARTLMSLDCVQRAERFGLYAALDDELGTRPLFDAVVARGAQACFPRTPPDDAPLEFAHVPHWDALREGRFSVLEPEPGAARVAWGADDVVVVPGVAFDATGGRLGRGRGYYDRTFPHISAAGETGPTLVGFAYEFQLVEHVPVGASDRRVRAVVTECGVHGPTR